MVTIAFRIHGQTISLPPITEKLGKVSMTDFGPPGTEILIIEASGRVLVSREGLSQEIADKRIVYPSKLILERFLLPGEIYERHLTTRQGEGILILKHEHIKNEEQT